MSRPTTEQNHAATQIYQKMRAAGQIDADAYWNDFVMFGRTLRGRIWIVMK